MMPSRDGNFWPPEQSAQWRSPPAPTIAQTQRPLVKPLPTEVIDHGLNQETRLETLHGYLTPSSHFFVRNHSATPVLDTPRAMATTCPCRTR